jgi:hypothetical protein
MIKPHLTKTSIMKRKSLMIRSVAIPMTAVMLLLCSCINDAELADNTSTGSDGTPKTLTLTINTGTANNAGTRATNITGTAPTDEATLNTITIGVFSSDGSKKVIQEFDTPNTNGSYTVTSTTSFTATDQVLVAVNAPTGTFNSETVTTADKFKQKTVDISTALTGTGSSSGVSESSSTLPMFGSTSSLTSDGTNYNADVNVHYMVSRVDLSSLSVYFDASGGYSSATFTPTEVFLTNVPAALDFYPYNSYTYYSSGSTAAGYYDGEYTATGTTTTSGDTYAQYLGTGTLAITGTTPTTSALSGTTSPDNTWGGATATNLYFYTTPNNPSNTSFPTRLVIKGDFDPDGSGTSSSASTVYYPVTITNGMQPGYKYALTVIIKTIGSTSPTTAFDSKSVDVTVTVNDFTSVADQTTNFE